MLCYGISLLHIGRQRTQSARYILYCLSQISKATLCQPSKENE